MTCWAAWARSSGRWWGLHHIAMQNYLAELGAWVTIVQGVIFVVCVLAFRRGIVGELEAFLRQRRK